MKFSCVRVAPAEDSHIEATLAVVGCAKGTAYAEITTDVITPVVAQMACPEVGITVVAAIVLEDASSTITGARAAGVANCFTCAHVEGDTSAPAQAFMGHESCSSHRDFPCGCLSQLR
jgi:beta-phosphoglucomutase-like phosphatase (HAD superfamily)